MTRWCHPRLIRVDGSLGHGWRHFEDLLPLADRGCHIMQNQVTGETIRLVRSIIITAATTRVRGSGPMSDKKLFTRTLFTPQCCILRQIFAARVVTAYNMYSKQTMYHTAACFFTNRYDDITQAKRTNTITNCCVEYMASSG